MSCLPGHSMYSGTSLWNWPSSSYYLLPAGNICPNWARLSPGCRLPCSRIAIIRLRPRPNQMQSVRRLCREVLSAAQLPKVIAPLPLLLPEQQVLVKPQVLELLQPKVGTHHSLPLKAFRHLLLRQHLVWPTWSSCLPLPGGVWCNRNRSYRYINYRSPSLKTRKHWLLHFPRLQEQLCCPGYRFSNSSPIRQRI